MHKITLFFDGACPLCGFEVKHLRAWDTQGVVRFEDISAPDFTTRYPELNRAELDAVLHAQWPDGRWVTGLDATLAVWQVLGKGAWIAPLRWPMIRGLADGVYLWFARNRHRLTSRNKPSPCPSCQSK